ncbi:MAG TPA: endonuclease/exonuclease/phosphatase family protein [Pyrinomonadaceae bacterium]|nr:endonuclease/exonuclease/phosphatase family protein [Pyrinomonadaceae bacterium]
MTALLILVCVLTFVSFFGHHVYLELTTHFRLQYAVASLACIVLLSTFYSWKLLPFAFAALVCNLIYILPYYTAAPGNQDRPDAIHLRLLEANVLGSNKNYAALNQAVLEAHADIVILQELTAEWQKQTEDTLSQYPFRKVAPKPGGSGMALFSRYPLEDATILNLDTSTHIAMLGKVNIDGTMVSILALHPPTPVRTDKFLNRNLQFSEAAAIFRATKGPGILIGDLNTTMWSPYFTDLVKNSGLRDARLGFGLKPSWPMPLPAILQLPIDHCLVSADVSVAGIGTGRRTGSDHRPLIVDLRIPKAVH